MYYLNYYVFLFYIVVYVHNYILDALQVPRLYVPPDVKG